MDTRNCKRQRVEGPQRVQRKNFIEKGTIHQTVSEDDVCLNEARLSATQHIQYSNEDQGYSSRLSNSDSFSAADVAEGDVSNTQQATQTSREELKSKNCLNTSPVAKKDHDLTISECFPMFAAEKRDPDNDIVDFLVDLILKLNVKVRCKRLVYFQKNFRISGNHIKKYFCSNYNDSEFSSEEDELIKAEWNVLMELACIRDPARCLLLIDLTDFPSKNLKLNVIGCFLARQFVSCRTSILVFGRAVTLICPTDERQSSKGDSGRWSEETPMKSFSPTATSSPCRSSDGMKGCVTHPNR